MIRGRVRTGLEQDWMRIGLGKGRVFPDYEHQFQESMQFFATYVQNTSKYMQKSSLGKEEFYTRFPA